jgi:hypothetical protein
MLQRSPETLSALEEAICSNAGDLTRACHSLGINPRELHQWTLADPSIQAAIKTAQMIGWASLESEAYRRAVLGVEEDVYYQGEVVGKKQVYSDGLLATLLKARVPGFAPEEQKAGVTVNVNLMPRASTYEEWLDHKQEALKQLTTDVQDAEYEPVSGAAKAAYEIMKPPGLRDVL